MRSHSPCIAVLTSPGNQCGAHSVSFSPSNTNYLASGHEDGSCFIWDLKQQRFIQRFNHHSDDVRTLKFSPDGSWLLTGSFDGTVGLVDMDIFNQETGALFQGHHGKVLQVAWHPSRPYFVTSGSDGAVKAWSTAHQKEADVLMF